LPDPGCTPGAIFPNATKDQICQSGYASSVRNVPQSVKDKAYASYGIASHLPGQYEVDHLVSLELGGSNEIANLWPEAASPTPGFHEKDKVENYLHDQMCSGAISLHDAQVEIATNWLAVYQQMQSGG
ncbi:MAG TPA: HNH endonuclease, partial [Ktedonobacterales bacterium]|nr:HNH endonuclease [Ktedonobacterales bacterium]